MSNYEVLCPTCHKEAASGDSPRTPPGVPRFKLGRCKWRGMTWSGVVFVIGHPLFLVPDAAVDPGHDGPNAPRTQGSTIPYPPSSRAPDRRLRDRGRLPSDRRCVGAWWQQELIRIDKAESLKDEMGNCFVSESQDAFEHNRDG